MKTFRKTIILVAIAGITTFFGCAKDGKDGLPGPTGANGATGTAGTDGNANVKSETFVTNTSSWAHIGTVGQAEEGYIAILSASIITNEIVNSEAVLAYYLEGTLWVALPVSFPYSGYTSSWSYAYKMGEVDIAVKDSDYYTLNPGTRTFKVVAIASSARNANPNVDYTNYYEVKAAFNLKD